jgi:ATP-dependent DNA ligase
MLQFRRNSVPTVLPQLVANDGLLTLQVAIADPERWAVEPKVDGIRGLVVFSRTGPWLKDPNSTYRDGSRRGWSKVKDPSWHQRERGASSERPGTRTGMPNPAIR